MNEKLKLLTYYANRRSMFYHHGEDLSLFPYRTIEELRENCYGMVTCSQSEIVHRFNYDGFIRVYNRESLQATIRQWKDCIGEYEKLLIIKPPHAFDYDMFENCTISTIEQLARDNLALLENDTLLGDDEDIYRLALLMYRHAIPHKIKKAVVLQDNNYNRAERVGKVLNCGTEELRYLPETGLLLGKRDGDCFETDGYKIEIVEPSGGKQVNDGQYGVMAITKYNDYAQPIIRYRTDWFTRKNREGKLERDCARYPFTGEEKLKKLAYQYATVAGLIIEGSEVILEVIEEIDLAELNYKLEKNRVPYKVKEQILI